MSKCAKTGCRRRGYFCSGYYCAYQYSSWSLIQNVVLKIFFLFSCDYLFWTLYWKKLLTFLLRFSICKKWDKFERIEYVQYADWSTFSGLQFFLLNAVKKVDISKNLANWPLIMIHENHEAVICKIYLCVQLGSIWERQAWTKISPSKLSLTLKICRW